LTFGGETPSHAPSSAAHKNAATGLLSGAQQLSCRQSGNPHGGGEVQYSIVSTTNYSLKSIAENRVMQGWKPKKLRTFFKYFGLCLFISFSFPTLSRGSASKHYRLRKSCRIISPALPQSGDTIPQSKYSHAQKTIVSRKNSFAPKPSRDHDLQQNAKTCARTNPARQPIGRRPSHAPHINININHHPTRHIHTRKQSGSLPPLY
jgi:hypothetical protein